MPRPCIYYTKAAKQCNYIPYRVGRYVGEYAQQAYVLVELQVNPELFDGPGPENLSKRHCKLIFSAYETNGISDFSGNGRRVRKHNIIQYWLPFMSMPTTASGGKLGESNAAKLSQSTLTVRLPRNSLLWNKMVTSGMQ